MSHRRPTLQEVKRRLSALRFWLGLALYLIIGVGGALLFAAVVHDSGWREIFFGVWWVPSGLAAYWIAVKVTDRVVAWVPDDRQSLS